MAEYIATSILAHNGKPVWPGEQLTLDEEAAQALGTKVVPLEVGEPDKPLSEMLMKELRPLAKAAGIEGYSTKDKDELIAALEPLAVNADGVEPAGD